MPSKASKILLVDDNQDILQILATKLRLEGFEVSTAKDAISGIIKAKQEIPGLILLDIMMPITDGFEALKRLKASPETQAIPVIMLTAKRQKKDVVRAISLGAKDYIVKPIDFPRLVEKLTRHIQSKESVETIVEDIAEPEPPPPPPEPEPAQNDSEVTTSISSSFSFKKMVRKQVALLELKGDMEDQVIGPFLKELTNIVEFDSKKLILDVTDLTNFFWFKVDNLTRIIDYIDSVNGKVKLVTRDQTNYQTLIKSKVKAAVLRSQQEAFQAFQE